VYVCRAAETSGSENLQNFISNMFNEQDLNHAKQDFGFIVLGYNIF
jgi:hypothetical protein